MLISFLLHIAGIVLLLLLTPSSAGVPRDPAKDRVEDPRILLSPVPGRSKGGEGSKSTKPRYELLPRYALARFTYGPDQLWRSFKLQLISGNRSSVLQSAGRKLEHRMSPQT